MSLLTVSVILFESSECVELLSSLRKSKDSKKCRLTLSCPPFFTIKAKSQIPLTEAQTDVELLIRRKEKMHVDNKADDRKTLHYC